MHWFLTSSFEIRKEGREGKREGRREGGSLQYYGSASAGFIGAVETSLEKSPSCTVGQVFLFTNICPRDKLLEHNLLKLGISSTSVITSDSAY